MLTLILKLAEQIIMLWLRIMLFAVPAICKLVWSGLAHLWAQIPARRATGPLQPRPLQPIAARPPQPYRPPYVGPAPDEAPAKRKRARSSTGSRTRRRSKP